MVEQFWCIGFSHSKEEQNTSTFLYNVVGITVKKQIQTPTQHPGM